VVEEDATAAPVPTRVTNVWRDKALVARVPLLRPQYFSQKCGVMISITKWGKRRPQRTIDPRRRSDMPLSFDGGIQRCD
jgi:hypothetical protein